VGRRTAERGHWRPLADDSAARTHAEFDFLYLSDKIAHGSHDFGGGET
jgi:hypothetical protein